MSSQYCTIASCIVPCYQGMYHWVAGRPESSKYEARVCATRSHPGIGPGSTRAVARMKNMRKHTCLLLLFICTFSILATALVDRGVLLVLLWWLWGRSGMTLHPLI